MSRTHVPRWLRERVPAQAGHRCGYCRTSEEITGSPLVIDHFLAEVLGGPTTERNLWMACGHCNLIKGDRVTAHDPLTEEFVLLFNPRLQRWRDHFQWTDDGVRILGLTPIGRATVEALQLNRPPLSKRVGAGCWQAGTHRLNEHRPLSASSPSYRPWFGTASPAKYRSSKAGSRNTAPDG